MWKEFLLTGELGPIRLGQPIGEVFPILGPPEDQEWRKHDGLVCYCNYSLIIVHVERVVYSIGIYFKTGTPEKPVLPTVLGIDMPFSGLSTRSEMISYLDTNEISWQDDTRISVAEALHIGRAANANFEEGHLYLLNSGVSEIGAIEKAKKRKRK